MEWGMGEVVTLEHPAQKRSGQILKRLEKTK